MIRKSFLIKSSKCLDQPKPFLKTKLIFAKEAIFFVLPSPFLILWRYNCKFYYFLGLLGQFIAGRAMYCFLVVKD